MNTATCHRIFQASPLSGQNFAWSTDCPASTSAENPNFKFFTADFFLGRKICEIWFLVNFRLEAASGGRMGDGWGTDAKVNSTLVLPSGGRMGRISTLYSTEATDRVIAVEVEVVKKCRQRQRICSSAQWGFIRPIRPPSASHLDKTSAKVGDG